MQSLVNWQIVSFVVVCVINLVGIVSAYYGLKADNASLAAKLDLDNSALAAKLDISLVSERSARSLENLNLKTLFLEMMKTCEQSIKELSVRVGTLETGQDEWTKSLRERTHELSTQVNQLVLKVDRLERPSKGAA